MSRWLLTSSALTCLFVTTASCGGTSTGPSSLAVAFSGVVHEYVSDRPLSGVTVRFTPDPPDGASAPVEATTASDGRYSMTVPQAGSFVASIDGVISGQALVTGASYRGDLFPRAGTCISRYGTVSDARTRRPIRGAIVVLTGVRVETGGDGWYRIDLGCPDVVLPGGTTVMTVSHPNYADRVQVVGRGVADVFRFDLALEPK